MLSSPWPIDLRRTPLTMSQNLLGTGRHTFPLPLGTRHIPRGTMILHRLIFKDQSPSRCVQCVRCYIRSKIRCFRHCVLFAFGLILYQMSWHFALRVALQMEVNRDICVTYRYILPMEQPSAFGILPDADAGFVTILLTAILPRLLNAPLDSLAEDPTKVWICIRNSVMA